MSIDAIVVLCTLAAGGLLLWPRLTGNRLWRATTTPLASIIGSGFLVLGPLLSHSYGQWAPAVMALLCLIAYAFGWAVRINIAAIDAGQRSHFQVWWDDASSWVLVVAYVISVAYYLNLFGAFGLSLFFPESEIGPKLLTSAAYGLIAVVGLTKGFSALELMERFSVGLKLAIIVGLLAGLAVFFAQRGVAHEWVFSAPSVHGISGLTLAFGLIVTVQGFETSRYLGLAYDAQTRIQSMRVAQWLSAAIYMVYVVLLTYSFACRCRSTFRDRDHRFDEPGGLGLAGVAGGGRAQCAVQRRGGRHQWLGWLGAGTQRRACARAARVCRSGCCKHVTKS